jgi:SecD/SecF fusion protein
MTTAGRNQLIGLALFLASLAALGGLLFYRQHWFNGRDSERAQLLVIKSELGTAREKRDKVVKSISSPPEEKSKALDEFKITEKKLADRLGAIESKLPPQKPDKATERPKDLGKRLEGVDKRVLATSPPWGWLGWPLAIFPIIAFLLAVNLATEHGRKFVITFAVAVTAVGLYYFREPIKGIDLSGGAELRYRMDTAEIDAEIARLDRWHGMLTGGGADAEKAKAEIKAIVADLEKQHAEASSEVSKSVLKESIDEHKQMLKPGKDGKYGDLSGLIDIEKRRREASVTMAVSVIRRRIDAAGIRQVKVRSTEGGRGLLAQLPTREIPYDPEKGEDYRRSMQRAQLRADLDEVRKLIETPGRLGLHHVDSCAAYQQNAERWKEAVGKFSEAEFKKDRRPQEVIPGYVMTIFQSEDRHKKSKTEKLLLRKEPVVTGEDLARALVGRGDRGLQVEVWLKGPGGQKMEDFTNEGNKDWNIQHERDRLAVVLDGDVKTAPTVESRLGSYFRITGNFTRKEVDRITRVLNAGSLTYSPKLLSENQVGPGLGQDSIVAGRNASIIGAALVVLFMGIYYLGAGLIADFALILNVAIILGAMNALGGTFTLPGIAGIALTIGMAVDANVLIFERVREEKLRGKPLKLAVKAGHDRALVTILDANITTLITAFILYGFGTGPVKGFAVTLSLGILASLFTALFVTRGFLEFVVDRGWAKELKMCRLVGDTKVSFMKLRPVMFAISAVLVAGAVALFAGTEDKYGLDFTGGMEVQVKFAGKKRASEVRGKAEEARAAMEIAANDTARSLGLSTVKVPAFSVQSFNPDLDGTSLDFKISCQLTDRMIDLIEGRTREPAGTATPVAPGGKAESAPPKAGTPAGRAESAPPSTGKAAGSGTGKRGELKDFFEEAFGKKELDKDDPFPMISRIGESVAGELLRKAAMALVLSVIFIFIYIVVRFDFVVGFGLGAAAALVHDAAISLGALLVANHLGMAGARVDLVIIAAVLTIIGYSLNDTIVVFDRIRENRAAQRSLGLRDLVDLSVNQTLSRTVLTSATTLLAVLSILILGGGTLRPFALVFTVGVIVGTYSSVFVASAVAVTWENWREKRREAAKKKLRSAPQGAR